MTLHFFILLLLIFILFPIIKSGMNYYFGEAKFIKQWWVLGLSIVFLCLTSLYIQSFPLLLENIKSAVEADDIKVFSVLIDIAKTHIEIAISLILGSILMLILAGFYFEIVIYSFTLLILFMILGRNQVEGKVRLDIPICGFGLYLMLFPLMVNGLRIMENESTYNMSYAYSFIGFLIILLAKYIHNYTAFGTKVKANL